jgi:hypothetical protein
MGEFSKYKQLEHINKKFKNVGLWLLVSLGMSSVALVMAIGAFLISN